MTEQINIDVKAFTELAEAQAGKLYRWAAKGPDRFDCSGLVTWCIHKLGGPDLREWWNAERMFMEFEPADRLEGGNLDFYASTGGRCSHVMIALPDERLIGACGGIRTTLTDEDALERKAFVQYRKTIYYRAGLLGFRRLQFRPQFISPFRE